MLKVGFDAREHLVRADPETFFVTEHYRNYPSVLARLDRLVEGDEDVLIDKGKILKNRLKSELITMPELEAAAHRQGFSGLAQVERAVLEPGGTISFSAKQPLTEDVRHKEILDRLERLAQELTRLKSRPAEES